MIPKIIKELIKDFYEIGFYEPVNDKIIGCTKGSYVWFHERRHQWQFKKTFNIIPALVGLTRIIGYNAVLILAIYGLLDQNYLLLTDSYAKYFVMITGVFMSPYLLVTCLMEVDAYISGLVLYVWHKHIKKDRWNW